MFLSAAAHWSPFARLFGSVLDMQWATQRASWSWTQSEDQRIRGQCKLRRWRFSWQSVILKSQTRYWRGFDSLVRQGIFLPELISIVDSFGVSVQHLCAVVSINICTSHVKYSKHFMHILYVLFLYVLKTNKKLKNKQTRTTAWTTTTI